MQSIKEIEAAQSYAGSTQTPPSAGPKFADLTGNYDLSKLPSSEREKIMAEQYNQHNNPIVSQEQSNLNTSSNGIDLSKISTSANGVKNGNFVKVNEKYFTGDNITVKDRGDGTAAIYSNGTVIGFTIAPIAAAKQSPEATPTQNPEVTKDSARVTEEEARKAEEAKKAEEAAKQQVYSQQQAPATNSNVNIEPIAPTSNGLKPGDPGYSGFAKDTPALTSRMGRNKYDYYENGDLVHREETYYNLNMNGVVKNAHEYFDPGQPDGLMKEEYRGNVQGDYWVRDDGAKMLGDYVMVAANDNLYDRGQIVETSLGPGVVVDTGSFAADKPYQFDIATTW